MRLKSPFVLAPAGNGAWVSLDDYESLEKELTRLRALLKEAGDEIESWHRAWESEGYYLRDEDRTLLARIRAEEGK